MNEEYDKDKHGTKRTLCPVCLRLGFVGEIENHMKVNHLDYIQRNKIEDKAFRIIEKNASRLRSDKFVAYTWPEYVGVKEQEVKLEPKEEDYRLLKHVIDISPYKSDMLKMMIGISAVTSNEDPIRYSKFSNLTACKFIDMCLEEKKISCECYIYEWLD